MFLFSVGVRAQDNKAPIQPPPATISCSATIVLWYVNRSFSHRKVFHHFSAVASGWEPFDYESLEDKFQLGFRIPRCITAFVGWIQYRQLNCRPSAHAQVAQLRFATRRLLILFARGVAVISPLLSPIRTPYSLHAGFRSPLRRIGLPRSDRRPWGRRTSECVPALRRASRRNEALAMLSKNRVSPSAL
jgi:hypothetical protein